MKKKIKVCLQKLSDYTTKHWILSAFILYFSSLWFALIVGFWGYDLKLIKIIEINKKISKTQFTFFGWFCTIIIIAMNLILVVLNRYKEINNSDKDNLVIMNAGYKLFDKMLHSVGIICTTKYSNQMKTIVEIVNNKKEPPIIYTEPCKQLETICSQISECISFLLSEKGRKFPTNELYVSIAYNFAKHNKESWHWADVIDEKGMSIGDLYKNKKTTFYYLLNKPTRQEAYVFFNSKQNAFDEGHYVQTLAINMTKMVV